MILTMVYAFLVATLLGLGALYADRICGELGWPRRAAWCVALLGSLALPALALLGSSETNDAAIISLPQMFELAVDLDPAEIGAAATNNSPEPWLAWPDWAVFDSAIVAMWIAGSTAIVLAYIFASLVLRRLAHRSERMTIDDQAVLVCDDVGPAVFGIVRPCIVLPRWLAEQESDLRSLVLQHEREHLAARDHLLLIASLAIVACMPWNLALWWQLKRLRTAMELDCDARVLRHGVDPRDYSEALFTVGQRPAGIPLGAVALTEPVSELERRIRTMLEKTRRFSLAILGSRLTLLSAATALALAVNAPGAQQRQDRSAAPTGAAPIVRVPVYEQLDAASKCMDDEDFDCARVRLSQVSAMTDLSAYETAQLYNFEAFLAFNQNDMAGAMRAYESLLGLPREEMADGLIRSSMRNLATLYVQEGRYEEGLETYDSWLEEVPGDPSPDDLYLQSTILYQMERYEDALEPIEVAIAAADEPDENHYMMLHVLQYQTDDMEGAVETLEFMNSEWPSERWANALTGLQQGTAGEPEPPSGPISRRSTQEEYLPVVTVPPVYPPRAAQRDLEGYVVVSYTVNERGETENIEVVESSAAVFDRASIEAVEKYRYRPRIVDGRTVAVEGVTARVIFELSNPEP
jgi:TonB family protein